MSNLPSGILTVAAPSNHSLSLASASAAGSLDKSSGDSIQFNNLYDSVAETPGLLNEAGSASPAAIAGSEPSLADTLASLRHLLNVFRRGNGLPQAGEGLPGVSQNSLTQNGSSLHEQGSIEELLAGLGQSLAGLLDSIEQQANINVTGLGLTEIDPSSLGDILATLAELEKLFSEYANALAGLVNSADATVLQSAGVGQGSASDLRFANAAVAKVAKFVDGVNGSAANASTDAGLSASAAQSLAVSALETVKAALEKLALVRSGNGELSGRGIGLAGNNTVAGEVAALVGQRTNEALALAEGLSLLRQRLGHIGSGEYSTLPSGRIAVDAAKLTNTINGNAVINGADTAARLSAQNLLPYFVSQVTGRFAAQSGSQTDALQFEKILSAGFSANDKPVGDLAFASSASALTQANSALATSESRTGALFTSQLSLPAHHAQWANQLAQRVHWFAAQGIALAELQLNPPELGPLQVRVDTADNAARVTFSAQNTATRELIETQIPRLRDLFADQGFDLLDAQSHSFSSQQQAASDQSESPLGSLQDDQPALTASGTAASELIAEREQVQLYYGLINTYA